MACSIRSSPEESKVFQYTAPSGGYTAWTLYAVNDTIVIAGATTTAGNEVVMYYWVPRVLVDCLTITSGIVANYDEGSIVYFDATTNAITHVAASNTACGIVTTRPAVGAVLCEIHLHGMMAL